MGPPISRLARSTSTWIHWWSPVASAKVLTRSWVTSSQSDTPTSVPTRRGSSAISTASIDVAPSVRGARSDDPRAFLAPIGVADQPLVEFAGLVARQFGHEVDPARGFHVAEVGAGEGR